MRARQLASEYYSIAKLVPSSWQRWRLLGKALWNCNAAIDSGAVSDLSGLLDIRGHVKLRMLNPIGGLSDLKRALAIRHEQSEGLARIGESEAHLGRAYAECRLNAKAERLLQAGVAKLRLAENRAFLVQALRHLGTFYARLGRRDEAITHLEEAREIAQREETLGQLHQIESELHALGTLQ
jgi:tetratricopeptide (TPR) repeat protein